MMNSSGGGAAEWEDSAGEMESEDSHAAAVAGMGMMEVDAHDAAADDDDPAGTLDRRPTSSSSSALPLDADFFNAFPDDFDDHDLS